MENNDIHVMSRIVAALEADKDADLSKSDRQDFPMTATNNIRFFNAVTVDLAHYKEQLALMDIKVDKPMRGTGLGSKTLKRVLALADQHGLPVELYSRSHSQSPLKGYDLSNWYERHGFFYTPRGHIRSPQTR